MSYKERELSCHRWSSGQSVAKYVAVNGPLGPSTAAIDGPLDHLWCRKVVPIATDGPFKLSLK